jgi:small subunit ribosomal protein S1
MVDDEDFAAMFEQSVTRGKGGAARRLKLGDNIEVTVVQIGKDSVFVDAGTRAEGEIDRREFEDEYGHVTIKVGDRLRATVSEGGDRPKLVMRFRAGDGLAGLEAALESGAPVEGTVSKAVKAGLEVEIGKLRAFCQALRTGMECDVVGLSFRGRGDQVMKELHGRLLCPKVGRLRPSAAGRRRVIYRHGTRRAQK